MARKIVQPSGEKIRATRLEAGLSRRQAAELVHAFDADGEGSYRTWQNWELEVRAMPLATWELFLLKTEKLRSRRK